MIPAIPENGWRLVRTCTSLQPVFVATTGGWHHHCVHLPLPASRPGVARRHPITNGLVIFGKGLSHMFTSTSFTKRLAIGASILASGLFAGAGAAQEATPSSPTEGYPVAIHEGTCDDLTAQPNYEIDNAVTHGSNNEDAEPIGSDEALPVVMGTSSTIDSSLNDLADQGNAVAVHASADDYDTIVACGNIAGMKDDGKLVVALNSVDDATVVGVAILDEDNAGALGLGDDQVSATIYLFDTEDTADDMATPAS